MKEVMMTSKAEIRWSSLKVMYVYTIIGAGGLGLGIIFIPDVVRILLGLPAEDPVIFGVLGSIYLSFGFLSFQGLRSPLKFVPILFLQLIYKIVWFFSIFFLSLLPGNCQDMEYWLP